MDASQNSEREGQGLGARATVPLNSVPTTVRGRLTQGGSRAVLEPWQPKTPVEKAAIRTQLELLLVHPLFFQSKRYPALLRFVVEQRLEGNAEQVKERLIGMEVFGRPAGYDANADPVVRVTAGEIRKRLAQYYYDPSHADELRIELPTGSYVPVFQRFVEEAEPAEIAVSGKGLGVAADGEGDAASGLMVETPGVARVVGQGSHARLAAGSHLGVNLLLVVLALSLGLGIGYGYRWWYGTHVRRAESTESVEERALADFWQPLTAGTATVTICLGEPARDSSHDEDTAGDPAGAIQQPKLAVPLYFRLRQSGLFALADVTTLTRMSAPLEQRHKAFRVSAASQAGFAQLREGPAILIGAFDNLWTMRLTRDLRFGFESIDGNAAIVDRRSKAKTTWFTAWDLPYEKLSRDYAIVARYRDGLTGQPVVLAAGISEEGTEGAGELISNASDLAGLLSKAPANWRNMNMEAVIETQGGGWTFGAAPGQGCRVLVVAYGAKKPRLSGAACEAAFSI